MSSNIIEVVGRQILDSRGNPTVEADVRLACGALGRAAVPSGASVGAHEALELRDRNPNLYNGKSVLGAVAHINGPIAQAVINMDATRQEDIDATLIALDSHSNEPLGANAILAVSMAVARAVSNCMEFPLFRYLGGCVAVRLPHPLMNVINGGKHADNNLDVQEFMLVPNGYDSFSESLRAGTETYYALKETLRHRGLSTLVGDEGGFAPNLESNEQALELLVEAIGKRRGIQIALDIAASELYDVQKNRYRWGKEFVTSDEIIDRLDEWTRRYPIVSIEDPLAEDDWDSWSVLTKRLGNRIQIVGDDLFVTNVDRIQEGIENSVANAVLIKPNQIGTLSQTIETVQFSRENGYKTIVSHRSGETEDAFIADLAVGLNVGQIKSGAPCRSDRNSKYNQLLRIEEYLGDAARY